MLLALGACAGNASAAANYYRERYPNRHHPDRRVIQRVEQMLSDCGSFHSVHQNRGRYRLPVHTEKEIMTDVNNLFFCTKMLPILLIQSWALLTRLSSSFSSVFELLTFRTPVQSFPSIVQDC